MTTTPRFARLISSFDLIYLTQIESLLKLAGIAVEQRNFLISGGAGELPFVDVMPELWVSPDDYQRAQQIIEELSAQDSNSPADSWECPDCHERIEGQFAQCWRCGHVYNDRHENEHR